MATVYDMYGPSGSSQTFPASRTSPTAPTYQRTPLQPNYNLPGGRLPPEVYPPDYAPPVGSSLATVPQVQQMTGGAGAGQGFWDLISQAGSQMMPGGGLTGGAMMGGMGGALGGVGGMVGGIGGGAGGGAAAEQAWMRNPQQSPSRNVFSQPGLADVMVPWQIGQWMNAPQNMVGNLNQSFREQSNINADRTGQRQIFNRLMDVIGGAVGSNRMSGFQDTVSGQGASLPGSVTSGIQTGGMQTGDIRDRLRGMVPDKKSYHADRGASGELKRTLDLLSKRQGQRNMLSAEQPALENNATLSRAFDVNRAQDSLSKAGLLAQLEAGNVQTSNKLRVPMIRALLEGIM